MNPDSSIHPRPIHRSKTLWAGILVLTFLAWAWWDSTHWQTAIRFRQYSIKHVGSGICLADQKVTPAMPFWGRYPVLQTNHPWARAHIDSPELFRSTGDPKQLYHYYTKKPGTTTYQLSLIHI